MKKDNFPIRSRPIRFFAAAASAFALGTPLTGHAGPEDAVNFVIGTTATYDDNLFRLPAGRAVPIAGQTSRSDMIYTAFAGVRFDKTYSLQRFQLDLIATRYEYQTYDYLNFSALDYRAAWLWALTPRLTGTLSADRTEKPTNYADFTRPNQRNIQTIENRRFAADWAADTAWHLIGGIDQTSVDNSGDFVETGDYVQDTIEAGIKYVSPANNSLALVRRQARGEYSDRTLGPALLDTGYDQSETELRAQWKITGHSSLDARLGYLNRNHDNYAQRDYSGAVGRLSYLWMPTGKLQFTLAAGRELYSYQDSLTSYYVYDFLSLIPAWLISEKTTLRLKLDLGQRDYRGSGPDGSASRNDTLHAAQISVAWRLMQSVDIGGYLTHERRSSNVADYSYQDTIAGISATFRF
jgi:exopolysaccharide biosynthesis operon protein EpsL